MTLKSIRLEIEAFWNRRKNDWERAEYQSWLTGYYTMYAIGCNFSNKVKYPKNPMMEEKPIEVSELTEDELIDVQEKALLKLDAMARNIKKK